MELSIDGRSDGIFEFEDSLRCRRDRFESIYQPLEYGFFDPPWIAKQLAFTIYYEKDVIDDLICRIKNGFCKINNGFHKDGFHKGKMKQIKVVEECTEDIEECTEDIEACTKELGAMITTDPRLCDLLGRDSLDLIVSLLKHEHNEKLQAHAAIILKHVVTYSNNTNEVGVVIENITPVVLHLICSPVDSVRMEALWLLRNLVFKISKSSIENALDSVTSIILDDSIVDRVLHPASEILIAVCQEHPGLSQEKLKLVVQALMKLIESNIFHELAAGCLGLALLCDGRKDMIVEEKEFKPLIRRLVLFMNWEDRGVIVKGLLCLGSIVRWGNSAAIKAVIQDEGLLHTLSILLEEGDMYIVKHVCWIISNITARKRKHSTVVVGGNGGHLFNLVVKVVQTCQLPDVVKEALWALSNAMCSMGSSFLVYRGIKKDLVRRIIPFLSDKLLVMVFLEGMVKNRVAEFTQQPPLAAFSEQLVRSTTPSSFLHRIFKSTWVDTDVLFILEFKFREPHIRICYDSLRKEWYSRYT